MGFHFVTSGVSYIYSRYNVWITPSLGLLCRGEELNLLP